MKGARLRGLRLALIFSGGLAAGCLLIDRLYPFENNVEVLGAKLEQLREHSGDYDTLFIGSSRVRRQLSPALFDRVARELGVETHSYNLGMSGMFAPEDGYASERFFALKPRHLKRVFIEITVYYPEASERNFRSTRMTYWHDFERTAFIWKKLWPALERPKGMSMLDFISDRGGKEALDRLLAVCPKLALHLQFLVHRLSNFGGGSGALGRLLGAESAADPQSELGAALDGYLPPDPGEDTPGALAQFSREFAELQKSPAQLTTLPPLEQRNLDGIIKLVRGAGAEPILLIFPTTNRLSFAPPKESGVRVLDFSDPKRWPELFRVENRKDTAHLNTAGSELLTRLLAEEAFKSR